MQITDEANRVKTCSVNKSLFFPFVFVVVYFSLKGPVCKNYNSGIKGCLPDIAFTATEPPS